VGQVLLVAKRGRFELEDRVFDREVERLGHAMLQAGKK